VMIFGGVCMLIAAFASYRITEAKGGAVVAVTA
jgi:hypothetical protein